MFVFGCDHHDVKQAWQVMGDLFAYHLFFTGKSNFSKFINTKLPVSQADCLHLDWNGMTGLICGDNIEIRHVARKCGNQ